MHTKCSVLDILFKKPNGSLGNCLKNVLLTQINVMHFSYIAGN